MTSPAKKLASPPAPPCATDGELLMRFVRRRDRSAIGELVHKHAPLVMAVCRQILGSGADADDAFQATFLILVKRARAIERKSCVAGWLYRVAYRTAMRLAVRRRRDRSEPLVAEPAGEPEVFSIISERETRRTLHEELARLPSRYREPILLFYFAGKTREEIAEELECTDAAVKGRLARGRKALRLALARRGVGLSVAMGAAVAASPSSTAAAAALADKTILACTSALQRGADVASCSPKAIQLAQEGVRAMLFSTVVKIAVAPAIVGVALVAFAQLPERVGEPPATGSPTGSLVLAADNALSSDLTNPLVPDVSESMPSFTSPPGGGISASAGPDGAGLVTDATSSPTPQPITSSAWPHSSPTAIPPIANPLALPRLDQPDAATSEMLAEYYEERAHASDVRQEAKRREIQAYGREAASERERLLRDAKQLALEADILDLRAESELFSSRAKLLRERREQAETPPSRVDASATGPAMTTPDVTSVVRTVRQDGAERYIEVSIGSDDGLQRGNRLTIYRGGRYLGQATITETYPDVATAVVSELQGAIQEGDRVTTNPMPPLTAARALETIQPGDRLMIEARGVFSDEPIAQEYLVEQGGTVALGPAYGRVPIGGLPLENAESVIKNHLREYVENPQVQVTRPRADASETHLQSLRAEIRNLRAELEAMRGGAAGSGGGY